MATNERRVDVVIFGAGIAGLWTLSRLTSAGYDCVLLERSALGDGQTIASQGIIHGGIKYTLGVAEPGDASREIAEMPAIWQACLEGRGEVDLRAARVLSPCQYLWTTPGLVSRVAGIGASRVIRTAVEKLEPDARPDVFAGAPRGVDVYRVGEPVLDVRSVVSALAAPVAARVWKWNGERLPPGLRAGRIVLAAGEGNAVLLGRLAPGVGEAMQRRPLHMAAARGLASPLYGHCLAGAISSTPRLTINAVPEDGAWTWYIGGEVAESGVKRDAAEQVAHVQQELRSCVPWVDASRAAWSTVRIDRAEARRERGARPDGPVVAEAGEVIYGWPTKLAFAPRFAAMVLERLKASGISPSGEAPIELGLPRVSAAEYPWRAR